MINLYSDLQYNVPDSAIALEELQHIPVPGVLGDISKIHFMISRHIGHVISVKYKMLPNKWASH